jgi:Family of unknown function (DUF6459)
MTVSHSPSRAAVVTPVVDYEPPVVGAEPCAPTPLAGVRRPTSRARHLQQVPHAPAPPSERFRAAAAFTDAAVRSILEVIDRRRPAAQLRPLLAGGLADTVESFTTTTPGRHAAAVLRRARLQPVDEHEHAFEVAASYSRGPRVHALACRVERVAGPRGERWQVVALHIG